MSENKEFNITGLCIPKLHYMVDTSEKVSQIIERYIKRGAYFTMNCARQYGKTTTLELLYHRLREDYIVLDISFEASDDCFVSMYSLALGLVSKIEDRLVSENVSDTLLEKWRKPVSETLPMEDLNRRITELCRNSDREIILMADEVDRVADNQLFLLFLGLLRTKYLRRNAGRDYTFKSVILAGVHDIKNLKMKLRQEENRKYNSPWNIAADFNVEMGFSVREIESMLREYEADCQTGMNIHVIAERIYAYTGGYPFLVSWICKRIDEGELSWTISGVQTAVKDLLHGTNTLFDDIIKNLENYPDFRKLVETVLVQGESVPFVVSNPEIARGVMYGIFQKTKGQVSISNQIFETYIYEYLISISRTQELLLPKYSDKSQYIRDGRLDMRLVLERFSAFLKSEYRKEDGRFIERQGRLLFLSFLRPIINGTGHYAVEAQTRQNTRMDIQVFYGSEEFIVELKLWHGAKKERDGYAQLAGYLDARGLEQGYLVSFCENLKTPRENQEIEYNGHKIYEVIIAYREDGSK
jgi:hypothetical protein